MGTVAHYLEVNAPAEKCYSWWRGLTNLPSIMPDVESITAKDGAADVTHWKVHGPLGTHVQWDAKVVEDVPNTKIAWTSVEPEGDDHNDVKTSGAVRFDDHGDKTGVEVSLDYDPPAGILGEAVAKLFANPQKQVEEAVQKFKETIERSA